MSSVLGILFLIVTSVSSSDSCFFSIKISSSDSPADPVLRNKFDFWNVHRIMNTWVSCKVNAKPSFALTLQETRSIHDSMKRPKIELIAYSYILLKNIYYIEIIYSLGKKNSFVFNM